MWSKIAPARRDVLTTVAREFTHHYGMGRTTLAVDGPDGSDTGRFADELAEALRREGCTVFRASVDDFQHPRAHRDRAGRFSPEGRYRDTFDYSLLKRVLLDPFRLGGSTGFQLAGFDHERDVPVESSWVTAPADAVLVVDGVFLHRVELTGVWHYSIWLDADPEVRFARRIERDPADPDSAGTDPAAASNRCESEAQRLYVRDARPNAAASVIVDDTDADAPVRRFADYCTVEPAPN